MIKLKAFIISNYKSIQNAVFGVEIPLGSINTLYGKNGSGKSAAMDMLARIRHGICSDFTSWNENYDKWHYKGADKRQGIMFRMAYTTDITGEPMSMCYTFEYGKDKKGKRCITNEELIGTDSLNNEHLFISVGANRQGIYSITGKKEDDQVLDLVEDETSALRTLSGFKYPVVNELKDYIADWCCVSFSPSDSQKDIYCDGFHSHDLELYNVDPVGHNLKRTLARLKDDYPDTYRAILQGMHDLYGVNDFVLEKDATGYLMFGFEMENGNTFFAPDISRAQTQMLQILVMLNSPVQYSLMCMKEPENGLDPEAVEYLSKEISKYADNHQVIISTNNSFELVNGVVYYFKMNNGQSQLHVQGELIEGGMGYDV